MPTSSPPLFRNIALSPEIVALGFNEIQVQAKNLLIRHQDGLLLISKYDPQELDKTGRILESKLAEHLGIPNGLPDGFDCKAFAALVTIALLSDIQNQAAEARRASEVQKERNERMMDEIRELKDDYAHISFDKWQQTLVEKYDNLKNVVNKKLPNIWVGLELGISNLRILNIDGITLPMIAILLGRPGSGKTAPIMLLSKWMYGYHTDDFSTKAWLTHTTSVNSPEELELIDLLRKVQDHQFLTPELATLFSLNEDDLRLALAKITRIADGHGFSSDSGVYGHRGYSDIMFTWIGAVVDISNHVYKVMSNLGHRLYFLRLPYIVVTAQDLYKYLTDRESYNSKFKAIEDALLDYLKWFEIGPTLQNTAASPHLRKLQWNDSKDDNDAIRCISELTYLLGYLRREGRAYTPDKIVLVDNSNEDDDDNNSERRYSYFTGDVEDTKRAGQVLKNLAKGHALLTGRNFIEMDDVKIVAKVVLSTARVERVKAFIALLDTGTNWISKKDLASQLNVSSSTAYRVMTELKAIELVDIEEHHEVEYTENNNPAMIKIMRLRKDFEWFLTKEFNDLRDGFTPVDNRKYIHEPDPEYEAAKSAAASTASNSNSNSNLKASEASVSKNDVGEENKKKLKAYDTARAKIRSDAAKIKRGAKTVTDTDTSTNTTGERTKNRRVQGNNNSNKRRRE